MSKVILRTLDNLENQPTALAVINQNFTALSTLVDTLVSRDGAVPNQMVALLDMNGRKIINLPAPTTPTEPARHGDIQQYVDQASDFADDAEASAQDADESETAAEAAADAAIAALGDLVSRYIGSAATDPTVDPAGNPLQEGALYFNTVQDIFYVYTVQPVDDMVPEVTVDSWEPIPVNAILSMSDITHTWNNNELVTWNTGQNRFIGVARPTAATLSYDDGTLAADNVQDAIDEVLTRTILDRYDIQFYLEGLMGDAEALYKYGALRTFTVPSNTSGFIATAGTAATATTTILLKKNGTQFGTIIWSAAGTVGAWTIPGDTVFNAGDIFTMQAPAVPDTALRDVIVGMTVRR